MPFQIGNKINLGRPNVCKGQKLSEEQKAKLSAIRKEYYAKNPHIPGSRKMSALGKYNITMSKRAMVEKNKEAKAKQKRLLYEARMKEIAERIAAEKERKHQEYIDALATKARMDKEYEIKVRRMKAEMAANLEIARKAKEIQRRQELINETIYNTDPQPSPFGHLIDEPQKSLFSGN